MADILMRRHGADVFEMSNRAAIQTIDAASLPGITDRISNHESGSNPNAHGVQNIGGLQGILDGKASAVHAHTISNITGLQTSLDGKASASHTHTISNVTGLQTNLDGKANVNHAHIISDIAGLQVALDGKEPVVIKKTAFNKDFGTVSGTVCEGDDSRLNNDRNPLAHTHELVDIVNLDVQLANKADKSTVTQDIIIVTGVDFVAQTITTATVKVVDGIITEII